MTSAVKIKKSLSCKLGFPARNWISGWGWASAPHEVKAERMDKIDRWQSGRQPPATRPEDSLPAGFAQTEQIEGIPRPRNQEAEQKGGQEKPEDCPGDEQPRVHHHHPVG